jgi:hydroxymethylpyrimidine/phosphomethylpyrimidine kinase
MKVDDGVTTVTRGIDSSSTTATVNTEIAAVMMTGGYTKETIASALRYLQEAIQINRMEVSDKYFLKWDGN